MEKYIYAICVSLGRYICRCAIFLSLTMTSYTRFISAFDLMTTDRRGPVHVAIVYLWKYTQKISYGCLPSRQFLFEVDLWYWEEFMSTFRSRFMTFFFCFCGNLVVCLYLFIHNGPTPPAGANLAGGSKDECWWFLV